MNEIFKTLDLFEASLPPDCSSCERIHELQKYVNALADRFDERCNDYCDSRCLEGLKK